jgi:hypothetical protein
MFLLTNSVLLKVFISVLYFRYLSFSLGRLIFFKDLAPMCVLI